MEVSSTENPFKKKEQRPSTERVSLGRRFEKLAYEYLENKGCKILESNIRFKVGEVDLFVFDPKRQIYYLVEVRGVRNSKYLPSRTLSPIKIRRLKTMARLLQLKRKFPVHILFLEIVKCDGVVTFREFAITN